MIHYHGTPITGAGVLGRLAGRCFCVSYARPEQVTVCHQIGQSIMLDNGAFSLWRSGIPPDWPGTNAGSMQERIHNIGVSTWKGFSCLGSGT